MKMRTDFLAKTTLLCALAVSSLQLSAQPVNKKEQMQQKRKAAQERVDKAAAEVREADSLITAGRRMERESEMEAESLLGEQEKLERRVESSLADIDKQLNADDYKVRKDAEEKRKTIIAAYNTDLKNIQDRYAAAIKKRDEGEKNRMRGQDKKKVVEHNYKEAADALKVIDKIIASTDAGEQARTRDAQRAQEGREAEAQARQREREKAEAAKQLAAQQAQEKRDADAAAKQKEKEKAEAARQKEKDDARQKLQADRDKEAAKRQAEKAKEDERKAKEKEKTEALKAKEKEKMQKEKEKLQKERDKEKEREAAKRQAEKDKKK